MDKPLSRTIKMVQNRKITEEVECQGNEEKLEDCRIRYKTNSGNCQPEKSIVSVTCVRDSFALW